VDRLIPLMKVSVGFKFAKLRSGLQDIIYMNRFDKSAGRPMSPIELDASTVPELEGKMAAVELDASESTSGFAGDGSTLVELESRASTLLLSPSINSEVTTTNVSSLDSNSILTSSDEMSKLCAVPELDDTSKAKRAKSEPKQGFFKRSVSKWSLRKANSDA
jgi:hypothetical protein